MGRLDHDILERTEKFAHRVVDVADVLAEQRRSRRVVDQLVGSGTSAAANLFEADEAMSRADFCKCLAIVVKELNETAFWLRFTATRAWIEAHRLEPLITECSELKRVFGSMLARVRNKDRIPQA